MGGENEKELTAEEQFDEAFDVDLPEDEPGQDDTDDKDVDAAGTKDAKEGDDKAPKEDSDGDDGGDPDDDAKDITGTEAYKALEKRFKDTQAWGTKLSQEIKELKDQIEKRSSSSDQSGEIPEEVQEFLADYPELEAAVRHIIGDPKKDAPNVMDELGQLRADLAQANYNNAMIGGFVKDGKYVHGHPDAWEVMATPEFQTFIAEERDKGNTLIESGDPADGIRFITQFKESVLGKASTESDAKRKKGKDVADDALSAPADEKRRAPDFAKEASTSIMAQEEEFDRAFDEF